ncbi:phosphatidylglycerol:prolipoprotein diacylglycerol transferase [Parasphingorhabdus marina DSM 22363]|uniref:Phosphatidylglycerol--prolipoprotein diacylglyceryl transferase n=1 Tax=Parasphingorhabdus marina DSM 22363 TaxID=1123272 RepID=A0A1N6DEQ2_9SPHN|nr:prolipoprotein diacylglyceryl transferase [Parasphingorhabdus marina]SIN69153.1 phosphatidylglycerol:prolipoprotein diacylglycerol transferase [Parasphingorhabdus marina DSM 22363]
MIDIILSSASQFVRFEELGLSPNALDLGFFQLKWYSLAYLAGIIIGYWYMTKLIVQPGAPLARRHADDMIFWATLGIIIGGRLGYVFFYQPSILSSPADIFKVWQGGMSLHGGVLGVVLAIWWISRKEKLSFLRVCDYVACVIPFGLLFGRLANFVNGELWGRATEVPWAIIFPMGGEVARHPSQLYEAGLEGILYFIITSLLFWKTDARYHPGKLVGTGLLVYGLSRFTVEFFRQPDAGLEDLSWGLTMGQTLTVPMILLGTWLVITARGRRVRIEPEGGDKSVA